MFQEENRARIFKLFRNPKIDQGTNSARPVRQPYSYSVPSPYRLFKNSSTVQYMICWNTFRGQEICIKQRGLNDFDLLRIRLSRQHMIPTPSPRLTSGSCLSFSVFLCVAGRVYWRGGGGCGGATKYGGEKTWSSINHAILSATEYKITGCNTSAATESGLAAKVVLLE